MDVVVVVGIVDGFPHEFPKFVKGLLCMLGNGAMLQEFVQRCGMFPYARLQDVGICGRTAECVDGWLKSWIIVIVIVIMVIVMIVYVIVGCSSTSGQGTNSPGKG